MGFSEGVGWSVLGAFAHTAIDVLRKCGAQRLPPADLIALLTLYNAVFAVLGVAVIDGALPQATDFPNLPLFIRTVVATAFIGLTAAVLYQRALSIAPLSLTVPYLAFAPVFVVFVSPLFLVGEVPSAMGLLGVSVVSVSGYLLGVLGAADAAAQRQQLPSSPSKSKLPLLAVSSLTSAHNSSGGSSKGGRLQQQPTPQHLELTTPGGGLVEQVDSSGQQHQQQVTLLHQRQPLLPEASHAQLLSSAESWTDPAAPQLRPEHLQQQQQHQQQRSYANSSSGGSSASSSKTKSPWAVAYYKQKYPPQGVWDAACGGLQSAAAQFLATASSTATLSLSPHNSGKDGGPHHPVVVVNGINGTPHPQDAALIRSSDSGSSSSSSWVDSQAKTSKELKADSKRARPGFLGSAAQRGLRALRLGSPRWLQRVVKPISSLMSGPSAGPAMVLITAFLYSLNASLDKLGMSASASTAFYIMAQRLLVAAGGLTYLVTLSPQALRHLYKDAVLLFSMSLVEQVAVVLYFKAIQNILVSYMVAIKRINVLLSTLVGCFMFHERVGKRIPYILVMLCGMLLIVLQPGHEVLHHSHHTRH